MTSNLPFENPNIAANYETWYFTEGEKAASQEKSLIKYLLSRYDRARTILEVGSGTGYFSHWMEGLGYEIYALDISRVMIWEANRNHRLTCIQGDTMALPFPSQSFDLIVMITTLEFISEPIQALSEAFRVARQGLILGVINKHSLLGWRYRQKDGPIWSVAKLYTPRELIRLVSGFTSEQDDITYKTALWPFFPGTSKLPWGGFIGLSVKLSSKRR